MISKQTLEESLFRIKRQRLPLDKCFLEEVFNQAIQAIELDDRLTAAEARLDAAEAVLQPKSESLTDVPVTGTMDTTQGGPTPCDPQTPTSNPQPSPRAKPLQK